MAYIAIAYIAMAYSYGLYSYGLHSYGQSSYGALERQPGPVGAAAKHRQLSLGVDTTLDESFHRHPSAVAGHSLVR